jgi:hypothetical protein
MSGKTLKPGWLAYRLVIWSVILVMLLGACGEAATSTPVPAPTTVPGPTPTPTIAFTSTPVPTPTPTEIPIVLPTATPPNPNLPPTAANYQPAFTQAPTYTPVPTDTPFPTDRPAPTVTPIVAPIVDGLAIYSQPIVLPYYRNDYIPYPNYTTQCIQAAYLTGGAPTPTPFVVTAGVTTTITPSVQVVQQHPFGPTPLNIQENIPAEDWVTSFETRYLRDARLNTILIPSPTFTPFPTSTPIPTWTPVPSPTPLPYNTPDVFTGLTAAPPLPPTDTVGPTSTPNPTATPIVPTSTPIASLRINVRNFTLVNSVVISDVTSILPGYSERTINFAVMWQVMNDLTYAMINVDTPIEVQARAYETYLTQAINFLLTRDLHDPTLPVTGEARYANRKIIIGNVPDLRAFKFYSPCFNTQQLQNAQRNYNAVISAVAAKYPNQVYVADLSSLNWMGNPQWISTVDGLQLTSAGMDAVANVFGNIFARLRF